MTQPYRNLEERLWLNSGEPDDGSRCRLWLGFCTKKGYGRICIRRNDGRPHPMSEWVHRVAYQVFFGGIIPKGMEVDHTCDRENCIAPWHLELVSGVENLARRDARRRALNAM